MDADEETGKDFRSWEENIYWTHFRSTHFFQFLHGDFRKQLAIPEKFAENMKSKLGENVILKGPSGLTWKVGLAAEEDGLFFKRGWEEFVKDHLLAEDDVLMFRYNLDSRFEVLIFDGGSLCEKEASYFCKRQGHKQRDCELGMKRKAIDCPDSEVVVESLLPQDAKRAPVEEPKKEETVAATVKERRMASRKRALPENIRNGTSPNVTNLEKRQSSIKGPSVSPTTLKEDKAVNRRSARKVSSFKHVHVSSKKAALSPEQILAIERAQATMGSESFMVIMQPTHVYKRFYMSIPVEWSDRHLSRRNQSLILRIKDKTWDTRYNYTARNCGGISAGWKRFALDNCLLESDVCLFSPGGIINDATVLDVTVFRTEDSVMPAVPMASLPASEEFF